VILELLENLAKAATAGILLCGICACCAVRFLSEEKRAVVVGWGSLACTGSVFLVWSLLWMVGFL